jgi:hypothetical protein
MLENLVRRYPLSVIDNLIKVIYNNISENKQINELVLNKEILYFPTYRRIEEDIINLGIDPDNIRGRKTSEKIRLINF